MTVNYYGSRSQGVVLEVREIRRLNVRHLTDKIGRRAFADKLGYSDTNYVNQIVKGHAKIGPGTSRKIEIALGLAEGWLDAPHPDLWGSNPEEVAQYTQQLLEALSTSDLSRLIEQASVIIRNRNK